MRNIQTFFLFFLLSFLTFSACTSDGPDAPAWKQTDNTVRVRQPVAIQTVNPILYGMVYEIQVIKLIFQQLMEIEHETFEMTPMLVKAPPVVEDIPEGEYAGGQKFIYEIRDEAVWDDGKPVTGHDVAFSMKVAFNPSMPRAQRVRVYIESVADVEVDAQNPKKFTVYNRNKYILAEPAVSNWTIIPAHIYDPDGLLKDILLKDLADPEKATQLADNDNLVRFAESFSDPKFGKETVSGSGPYKLVEWVDGQRVVLAKKENWWGDPFADTNPHLAAYPDTFIFVPIPDQAATVAAIKDEAIDVAIQIDPVLFTDLKQNEFVQPMYDFYTPPTYTFFATTLNNRNPKLSDKRVRRALAHLVDMDMVINDLYDGLGERSIGPIFPDKEYFDKSLTPIPYDPDKARQLLKEAGWEDTNGNGIVDKEIDGEQTEMKLEYLYYPASVFQDNFTELFKENAQKVGIEIERAGAEANVIGQRRRNGDYEMAGWGAQWLPLPDDLRQLWHTDSARPGGSNYSRFGNAESDSIIDEIAFTTDEAERNELYLQIQKIIYDEQPVIFQLTPLEKIVVHKRFDPVISRMGLSLQHLKNKNKK